MDFSNPIWYVVGGVIALGILSAIASLFNKEKKTVYDADFVTTSKVLSRWNKGFCLTGKQSLTIKDSFKNALVIGATGNYKSSGILIPSILKMRGHSSLVITDFTGELLLKTSGALLKAGYQVMVLNPGMPHASEGYNPLLRAQSTSDIQKISKLVVVKALGTGAKDPFWNVSAESLISLTTKFVIAHTPKEYHSLYSVYHLISLLGYAPEKLDRMIARSEINLINEYKSFISYGERTLSSVIATCRSALSLFGTDDNVALTSCFDTINFSDFKKRKIALFLNTSTKDMRYYSLFTSLFLEQFFGEIMSHLPQKNELPVFFLIEEASSLYFNSLQITLSNIRKYNSGILQIYQSAGQIIDLYGAALAKAISENSFSRIYMPPQPISVAQELEASLGRFEYLDDKKVRHIRPLMAADEIAKSSDSIILYGQQPIKTKITPYFKRFGFKRLTELTPFQPMNKLPYDKPPLIPFEDGKA